MIKLILVKKGIRLNSLAEKSFIIRYFLLNQSRYCSWSIKIGTVID